MIRLHLLGSVRLLDGDGRDIRAVLQQPKRLALLAFLAAARPHGAKRRDTLTGMFWGESDDASARRSLSQAIYFLRQKVHPDLFAGRFAEEIDLRAGEVWCDVVEFERALDEGRTADALALYTGELMPGFHISEAPEWEKWLDTERDRLRKRAADAAWALAGSDEQAGRSGMAAHWARWAAGLTPFDEQAHRKVLELLVRTGDRAGALRTHEEFVRRLATEYEVEPSAETAALVEAIRRDVGGGETDVMVEKAAQGLRRDAGRSPDPSAGSETGGRGTAGAESPTTAAAREGLAAASAGTNPAPADHTTVAVIGGAHGTEDASKSRAVFRSTRRRGGKRMTPARGAIAIALAVALLESRGFTAEDFARSHPSGSLGKRLILRVSDVMHTGDEVPAVSESVKLAEGLVEMSRKGLGMTAIVDDDKHILGIFTDGDLRRALDADIDVHKTEMSKVMHRDCKTVPPDILAAEAVHLMEEHKITGLLVADADNRLVGALNVHDLFRAGIM